MQAGKNLNIPASQFHTRTLLSVCHLENMHTRLWDETLKYRKQKWCKTSFWDTALS